MFRANYNVGVTVVAFRRLRLLNKTRGAYRNVRLELKLVVPRLAVISHLKPTGQYARESLRFKSMHFAVTGYFGVPYNFYKKIKKVISLYSIHWSS